MGQRGRILLLPCLLICSSAWSAPGLESSFDSLRKQQSEVELPEGRPVRPLSRRSIFRVISWNVQTFGGGVSPKREAAYGELLEHMFATSRSAKVLAVQEIANEEGAAKFRGLLPGGDDRWNRSFENTGGSQDNGFFTQRGVTTHCEQFMFARDDGSGRVNPDRSKALHPVRIARMQVDDFDFTLITLHLRFSGGDPQAPAKELGNVFTWLEEYFQDPANDPDVIIAGDFNLPTRNGHSGGSGPALEDIVGGFDMFAPEYDQDGRHVPKATELYSLVDEPTSRSGGQPANNYDHFIVSGDVYHEEYVADSAGHFPVKLLAAIEERHETHVSDHLPISAGFLRKGTGADGRPVALDQVSSDDQDRPQCWADPKLLAQKHP
jgi:hypothetical protein